MTFANISIGLVLGALGGGAHLLVTQRRARLVGKGQLAQSVALAPLGFVAVALSVLLAAAWAPEAAWACLPGLLVVRTFVLARLTDAA